MFTKLASEFDIKSMVFVEFDGVIRHKYFDPTFFFQKKGNFHYKLPFERTKMNINSNCDACKNDRNTPGIKCAIYKET